LKHIGLDLELRQSFKMKTPTKIGELQHMKYISNIIIFIMKYEKLHTYFKTKVMGGTFWWNFCDHYFLYTSIESRVILKFKCFAENSFKICVFSSNKSKILCVFKEKPMPNER